MALGKNTSFGQSAFLLLRMKQQINDTGLKSVIFEKAQAKLTPEERVKTWVTIDGPEIVENELMQEAITRNSFDHRAWFRITKEQKRNLSKNTLGNHFAVNALMTQNLQSEIDLIWAMAKDTSADDTLKTATRDAALDVISEFYQEAEGIRVRSPSFIRGTLNLLFNSQTKIMAANAYRASVLNYNETTAHDWGLRALGGLSKI